MSEWVKVSDRLPPSIKTPEGKEVLALWVKKDRYHEAGYMAVVFHDGARWWGDVDDAPTHWMPLPPLPEPDK